MATIIKAINQPANQIRIAVAIMISNTSTHSGVTSFLGTIQLEFSASIKVL